MIPALPCLHIARITIQTRTPLSVGTGLGAGHSDTALVRDANGLPAIPGASIAGVLRHIYRDVKGSNDADKGRDEADKLFGRARLPRRQNGNHRGGAAAERADTEEERQEKNWIKEQPSHLHVSWAAIHDSNDRPVEGLLLGERRNKLTDDPLLLLGRGENPLVRDHIRIDHRGAADGRGKFDRTVLPAGYRFSFELSLWSSRMDDDRMELLLGLLRHPRFRLGGATRRGLGGVKPVSIHRASFDLRKVEDRKRFAELSSKLGNTDGLQQFDGSNLEEVEEEWIEAKIILRPLDFWRFGQGVDPKARTAGGKEPDLVPVREAAVQWDMQPDGTEAGKLGERRLLVPASGIKGALRHRVAFHYARLENRFADDAENGERPEFRIATWTESNPAVRALFGTVKNSRPRRDEAGPDEQAERDEHGRDDGDENENERNEGERETGRAGRFLHDDVWVVDQKGWVMPHNSIDRFTGGVREGFLFTEELAERDEIKLTAWVLYPWRIEKEFLEAEQAPDQDAAKALAKKTAQALDLALLDLIDGRLAIGAGGAKGHGYCEGDVEWSDGGAWARGERP